MILRYSGSEIRMSHIVEVSWADRWQVYQRLNELDIPCCCQTNQPLQVEINNLQTAIQVWNVTRQFSSSRQDLICSLEKCWHSRYQTS